MRAWTERCLADRERTFAASGATTTTVLAGACLLGPEDVHAEQAAHAAFWVPAFEVEAGPSAFRRGDLIAIPPHVLPTPALAGARLRVVARSWTLVAYGRGLVRDLTLVCCDADPDETVRRYRRGG